MKLDKFTVKAQEAVQAAQTVARRRDHQQLEPEHLLAALLEQEDGVAGPVLERIGADLKLVRARVEEELNRLPKVQGGTGEYMSPRLAKLLDAATDEAKKLKDEYVSTEHLLLAL